MKANLDKWIEDAKDNVPDSGEYRRLNRAMLKEHMANMAPRRRRRHRVLLGGLSLVFLMLYSGQLNQLGSDGFDTIVRTETTVYGETKNIHENVFLRGSVGLPRNFSETDADEFHRSAAAGEGEVVKVTGLSYGGKTAWNIFITKMKINDMEIIPGGRPNNPKSEFPDNYFEFLKTNFSDLKAKTNSAPHHRTERMIVDGQMVEFQIWTFEYPGYGPVTRYLGTPVKPQ
jgi:hypothetical protein